MKDLTEAGTEVLALSQEETRIPTPRFVPTPEEAEAEQKQALWWNRIEGYTRFLDEAVGYLRFMYPKIGFIIDSFQVEFVLTEKVSTATVTGDGTIYFNPYFLERAGWNYAEGKPAPLDTKETAFVIFHEIGHILYDFHGRLKGKIMLEWNVAQDEAINWIAHKMNLTVINNPGFKVYLSDWAEELWDEEIYYRMQSQKENSPQQGAGDNGEQATGKETGGNSRRLICEDEDYSPEETEERMTQWKKGGYGIGMEGGDFDFEASTQKGKNIDREMLERILQRAAKLPDQIGRGTQSAGLERLLQSLKSEDVFVPWQTELETRLLKITTDKDEDWSRPRTNRIGVARNLEKRGLGRTFFPDEEVEYVPIYVGVDTSGSVDDETLAKIVVNLKRILQADGISSGVRFMAWDVVVHVDRSVIDVSDIVLKGGEGSNSCDFFKRCELSPSTPLSATGEYKSPRKADEEPGLIIVFSDFEVEYPSTPPPFKDKVIWIFTGKGEVLTHPPFGEVIRMHPVTQGVTTKSRKEEEREMREELESMVGDFPHRKRVTNRNG